MATTNKDENTDNWSEYRRLVLNELERLDLAVTKLAEAILVHEKNIMKNKEDLIYRMGDMKDAAIEKIRDMIKHVKDELEDKENEDILRLHERVNAIEEYANRINTEIKVLKGKAAMLGFLAGLIVAIISLVIAYFEQNGK